MRGSGLVTLLFEQGPEHEQGQGRQGGDDEHLFFSCWRDDSQFRCAPEPRQTNLSIVPMAILMRKKSDQAADHHGRDQQRRDEAQQQDQEPGQP